MSLSSTKTDTTLFSNAPFCIEVYEKPAIGNQMNVLFASLDKLRHSDYAFQGNSKILPLLSGGSALVEDSNKTFFDGPTLFGDLVRFFFFCLEGN